MHYFSTLFGKERRQIYCPKHVEFFTKLSWEIVHLVDFIIRIYHDARFSECQSVFHLVI